MRLNINTEKCIGCGLCKQICIRDNIDIVDGVATELETDCFDCGQCMALCPNDAIRLKCYINDEDRIIDYNSDDKVISQEDMLQFLKQRRSCRWFKDKKISKETFDQLFEAAYYSPTGQNLQTTEFAVISENLDEFLNLVWDIIKVEKDEFPRIKMFGEYLEDKNVCKAHPLLWEGKQIIAAFSEDSADSLIAMTRIELMAYAMGLGGFYSLFIMKADRIDHERLMKFFPDISPKKRMQAVFIIGYPRLKYLRTIPHKPINVQYK